MEDNFAAFPLSSLSLIARALADGAISPRTASKRMQAEIEELYRVLRVPRSQTPENILGLIGGAHEE